MRNRKRLQDALLNWYAENRRAMPWRALPGHAANPYHVWLSEIMLQQTTVAAVIPYFLRFIDRWPMVADLAAAKLDDVLTLWAGLGYYARARNLHACAQAVMAQGGRFPDTADALRALPGIGPYTAAAIASIAFGRQAVAVDGNVERVISRLLAIETPLPSVKPRLIEEATYLGQDNPSPADFTQAFMELGATVCTPRNPRCDVCPWAASCAGRKQGIAATLPRRAAKKKKPVRRGRVFWIEDGHGRFCLQKRNGTGLYAGLYLLPTTDWTTKGDAPAPFTSALQVEPTGTEVRHSFTHFDLTLEVWRGKTRKKNPVDDAVWVNAKEARAYALPSLMQAVVRLSVKN